MSEHERFQDNNDETLTDTKFNLMWTKQDSYQIDGKWCTWKGAHKFVARLNEQSFAGYTDWRLPTSQESRNLYDHDSKNSDYLDDIVHIDLKFPEGCGFTYWCNEENGINAMAYNFYSDRAYLVRKKNSEESNLSCRPVRTAGAASNKAGRLSATGRTRRE